MHRIFTAIFFLILAACGTTLRAEPAATLIYHWSDDFTAGEQDKLTTWIDSVQTDLESLTGPPPFAIHVTFHRADGGDAPIPWAHTTRGRRQGVTFHVNPSYSLGALRADWTASHELSHLVIPYLGSDHAWFAEGFASYMQYQVMAAGGVIAADAVSGIYKKRFERARNRYDLDALPFAAAAPRLRAARRYPTMYWGGAVYFWQVEQALQARGATLTGLLRRYVACCRSRKHDLDTLIATLDGLTDIQPFAVTLARFRNQPGFPVFN